jgi:hypothetical protein
MDKQSAIQQAQAMFKKLVDSKLNGSIKPMAKMRAFPVATLPGGQVALSNGKTKVSYPMQRAQEIMKDNFNQVRSPQEAIDKIKNINMEITTPARDMAMGGPSGQNYFVNLLAQALKPKLQGSADINQVLPGVQDKTKMMGQTSALSNLPQMKQPGSSVFQNVNDFYKRYLANSGANQQSLAEEFMANYNGQQENNVNMGNVQKYIPLSQNYQNRFGIPSANNVQYAKNAANSAQAGLQKRI